jgi:hypothetical protein
LLLVLAVRPTAQLAKTAISIQLEPFVLTVVAGLLLMPARLEVL